MVAVRVAKPGGYTSVSGGFNKFWGGNGQNSCAAGLALTGFLGTEAQVSCFNSALVNNVSRSDCDRSGAARDVRRIINTRASSMPVTCHDGADNLVLVLTGYCCRLTAQQATRGPSSPPTRNDGQDPQRLSRSR